HVQHMILEDKKMTSRTIPQCVPRTDLLSIPLCCNKRANGAVKIDLNSLEIIQKMMDMEAKRLSQCEKCVKMLESFEARLTTLEGCRQAPQPSTSGTRSYARATVLVPKLTPMASAPSKRVLHKMKEKFNSEPILIQGAQVLKSGDVCFFSKNNVEYFRLLTQES
ncbi:uncharacterized protein VP01_9770g1, partial [Puccinia sorghi]